MDPILYQLEHRILAYHWSHAPVAQPLVVIHGLGDSAIHTYAPRFASTSLQHTPSLFIDLPGFGTGSASEAYTSSIEAMADDVMSLLTHLGVRNAPIFAHSMGASVAIMIGTQHPKLARTLILAEPLLDPANSILAARIARFSERSYIHRGHNMLVRATKMQANRGDAASIAFLPTLRQASPRAIHRASVSQLLNRTPSFAEYLEEIPHPTTVLLGGETGVVLPPWRRTDIRVKRVDNAGHHLMVDAAEPTACAILESVNGVA